MNIFTTRINKLTLIINTLPAFIFSWDLFRVRNLILKVSTFHHPYIGDGAIHKIINSTQPTKKIQKASTSVHFSITRY